MSHKQISCSKCGNANKFYEKQMVKGKYHWNWEVDDKGNWDCNNGCNQNMYDCLEHQTISKYLFCSECDSKVIKLEQVIKTIIN